MEDEKHRIETEEEVRTFIDRINYALNCGAEITFQEEREVDRRRRTCYTNKYTVANLFPRENPVIALKRELRTLTVKEYIETVKDNKHPERSEMRVFGKVYRSNREVYIKVRAELLKLYGNHTVFVMSFHFAEVSFASETFPYKELH